MRLTRTMTGALVAGLVLTIAACHSPDGGSPAAGRPGGWIRAGSHPSAYEMGVDAQAMRGGKPSAFIKGKSARPPGFGTLMQTIDAQDYRGKRVRLSGWVKAADIASWAGLWMRVDGPRPDKEPPLAFDNMQDRAIKGTQDWRSYDVVLDVAPEATAIAFGILLEGSGEAWLNDVHFDLVGPEVAVTSRNARVLPREPVNLDFVK